MKLILALGNPGPKYQDTRHNVGWWAADRLAAAWDLPPFRGGERAAETEGRLEGQRVRVVKPLTYVNRSGAVLAPLVAEEGLSPREDLLVLVDDVWLPPGEFRVRAAGSAGGHRGLLSVEGAIGSREYGRLRIGVGRPEREDVDLAEWVLSPLPAADEERVLSEFDRVISAVECWLDEGMEATMNRFN